MLQHQWHHGMIAAEFFQHGGIGAEPGFGASGFLAIEPKGVEQKFPQLFG
ncbi:MAG: Uncharacterised protein [Synechococcus sp. CC9902]|nr:MAG: Uncharacterised protein [Synechococcus sp. CC9902]